MKVIAKTKDGFIVELTNNQMTSILGKNPSKTLNYLEIGDIINLSSTLDRLAIIKETVISGTYQSVVGKLKDAKDKLEKDILFLESINPEYLKVTAPTKTDKV